MDRLLLHACCAPCSTYCFDELSKEYDVTLFWFNPNIHPSQEYINRRDSLIRYAELNDIELLVDDNYDLNTFLKNVVDCDDRCRYCYNLRLVKTAKMAVENGFEIFSTTLLISPYQDHGSIKECASTVNKTDGVDFLYRDMRGGFRKSRVKARDSDLYMQKYCGCVFSEAERYGMDQSSSL